MAAKGVGTWSAAAAAPTTASPCLTGRQRQVTQANNSSLGSLQKNRASEFRFKAPERSRPALPGQAVCPGALPRGGSRPCHVSAALDKRRGREHTDYYATLGVPRAASQQEIKAAFRKLARQLHPDVQTAGQQGEERFRTVLVAYQTLTDVQKRIQYDRQLPSASAPQPQHQPSGARSPAHATSGPPFGRYTPPSKHHHSRTKHHYTREHHNSSASGRRQGWYAEGTQRGSQSQGGPSDIGSASFRQPRGNAAGSSSDSGARTGAGAGASGGGAWHAQGTHSQGARPSGREGWHAAGAPEGDGERGRPGERSRERREGAAWDGESQRGGAYDGYNREERGEGRRGGVRDGAFDFSDVFWRRGGKSGARRVDWRNVWARLPLPPVFATWQEQGAVWQEQGATWQELKACRRREAVKAFAKAAEEKVASCWPPTVELLVDALFIWLSLVLWNIYGTQVTVAWLSVVLLTTPKGGTGHKLATAAAWLLGGPIGLCLVIGLHTTVWLAGQANQHAAAIVSLALLLAQRMSTLKPHLGPSAIGLFLSRLYRWCM